MKCLKIKGKNIKWSVFGKSYENAEITILVEDNRLIELNKQLTSCGSYPQIINGEFIVKSFALFVESFEDGNTEQMLDELSKHNLVWDKRICKSFAFPIGAKQPIEREFEYEGLFYASKENFIINLNGKEVLYKDLDIKDKYIVLKGDNGYSHWWSATANAEKIHSFIDRLFAQPKDYKTHTCYYHGIARSREIDGFNFGNYCQLEIITTNTEHHESQVSNT